MLEFTADTELPPHTPAGLSPRWSLDILRASVSSLVANIIVNFVE